MTTLEMTPQETAVSTLEVTPTTDEIITIAEGFSKLNLSDNVLKAVAEMGFTAPSGIQAGAIPEIMKGIDIIAKAPTGSGKTAAFAIPILENLDTNYQNKNIQALVLCPTRELAIQVHREFEKLSKYLDNVNVVSVYGGQPIEKQMSALRKHPQIVVATPGRLMDHLRRGSVRLDSISMVVLDEADEMLDMGFRDDIHTILEDTPEDHQTVLFSATMAKDIVNITKKFQKNPIIVDVMDNQQSIPDIEQLYFEVSEKDKVEVLTRLLDLHSIKLALVFCNTKSNVDRVVEILKTRGYLSDSLHGDMNQVQREKVMRGFRNGGVEILVATDVAGRGIDVKNIEAVFNYDLPRDDEDYVHRIGRTARAGKSGTAFTFVSRNQVQSIRRIERSNGALINRKEIPSVAEIELARTNSYETEIKAIIKDEDLSEYAAKIEAMVSDECSIMDIAATLLKLSMKKASKRINKDIVFGSSSEEGGSRGGRGGGRSQGGSRSGWGSRDRDSRGGGRGGNFGGGRDRNNGGGRDFDRSSRPSNQSGERSYEGNSERSFDRSGARRMERDRFRSNDRAPQQREAASTESFGGASEQPKKSYNKDFGNKSFGEKKFGAKKFGDKKFGEKKFGSFAKRERPSGSAPKK